MRLLSRSLTRLHRVIEYFGWRWIFLYPLGPMCVMYLLALLVLPFDAKSSDMSPRSASGAESARSKLKEFD